MRVFSDHGQDKDPDFVYIYMELCGYTRGPSGVLAPHDLAWQVERLPMADARLQAAEQLC